MVEKLVFLKSLEWTTYFCHHRKRFSNYKTLEERIDGIAQSAGHEKKVMPFNDLNWRTHRDERVYVRLKLTARAG